MEHTKNLPGSETYHLPPRRHRYTAKDGANLPASANSEKLLNNVTCDTCVGCCDQRSQRLCDVNPGGEALRQPCKLISRRLYSRGRSVYTNFIGGFFVFILTSQILTHAAVTRVPYFLDVEQALESSKCTVREEVVDVRKIHPTLPSDAIYMPSCVVLNRCSGCCQSDMLQCKPTSAYVTKMMIWQQRTDPPGSEQITLEFTHHDACECKSYDDTTTICVQRECEEHETWSSAECSCVPTPAMDTLCMPKKCGSNEGWNPSSCSCVQCGTMQFWNPNAGRCQCRPCHPKRLYHVRFNQNSQTCQCSCRDEHRGRAACRRKGAIYNTETCTCEKNHRGRRG